MELSVIIPVYNEARTIEAILRKVDAVPLDKEIILVDDASRDESVRIIEKILPSLKTPAVLKKHPANRGKGAALRTGFSRARGRYVVIQDADLEYDPADFTRLLEEARAKNIPVVYGSRFLLRPQNMTFSHYWGNRMLSLLTAALFGAKLTDMETCYKLIRADVLRALDLRAERFEIEPEITAKILAGGHGIVELPIAYEARTKSEGKKINWRDGFAAVRMLLREKLRATRNH